MMKKVLHVCKVYLPHKGGIQAVVEKIYKNIKKQYKQEILTTRPFKSSLENDDKSITVVRALVELRSLPIAPSVIVKLWKNLKSVDITCIHYPFPLADIAIATYPFRQPKLVVYWHSEIVSQKYLKIILRPFTERMLRLADKIVVSSPEMVKHSSLISKHRQKTIVIPFGIDKPSRTKDSNFNSIELLAIGRHVPYKGYTNLIQAISSTKYHLTIVGDGPLRGEHERLVDSLNLKAQVKFISDADDQQLNQLLESCKALIFPSIMPSEAFGLVQIEAMSHGKPIINTQLKSGVPWVARHMKEAITVEPNNIIELKRAIELLMTDHTLFSKLSEGARTRYEECFSSEQFLESTINCYDSVLT